MAANYQAGSSHNLDFGSGYGEDQCGICLYGDQHTGHAPYAIASHPAQAALADRQKFSFWFRFAELRPYGEVDGLFKQVADLLEERGWTLSEAIEGLPGTGSSIGGLKDTDTPEFWGDPVVREFPAKPAIHGYNATSEFVAVVEKPGTKPVFTEEEIAEIREAMAEAMEIVFGTKLPERDFKSE